MAHARASIRFATLALVLLAAAPAPAGVVSTTTTAYHYNADGALTAVTTQVDGAPARTAYLTWDNFTPDAARPADGTVRNGDGNLVGLGAQPGRTGDFAYDVRDRLTDCTRDGRPATSYAYHAASLMKSSTLASGDALQFYYDNASAPWMINTTQPSSGAAASFLGPVRYLDDGTEQILLAPRKDTAGEYDAADQTLAAYAYDPYGASPELSPPPNADEYDLGRNPFRYSGEYQDPSCDTYYLRARWYLPEHQTFLSRDPVDPLHRYGYTAGNPVGRTDPSGFRYTGAEFTRDVDKAVHKLSPGVWAYVEPVLPVWGQVLGGIQLVGLLPSFFHHPTTEGWITFSFLSASIVAEAGTEAKAFDRALGAQRAFGARLGIDAVLGGSQTAAQSDQHGRFEPAALIQGVETTMYGIFWSRLAVGHGYRPFGLSMDDVDRMSNEFHAQAANAGRALVFRIREDLARGYYPATPLMDWSRVGAYHDAIVAVGPRGVFESEISVWGYPLPHNENIELPGYSMRFRVQPRADPNLGGVLNPSEVMSGRHGTAFQLVGDHPIADVTAALRQNPLGFPTVAEQQAAVRDTLHTLDSTYSAMHNNCHDHVAAVLRTLGH